MLAVGFVPRSTSSVHKSEANCSCLLPAEGYVIHEGTSCAAYLVQKYGVPPDHILKEWSSYDTIANGKMPIMAISFNQRRTRAEIGRKPPAHGE
jgi:hypothetical protein